MKRIFVESNFILEVAFQQEEAAACAALLAAVERQQCQLVLPGYSAGEVFETLRNRSAIRREAQEVIRREIIQHQREKSVLISDMETLSRLLRDLLLERTTSQTEQLFATVAHLLRLATVLPLTALLVEQAYVAQQQYSLGPQDALVYSSVCQGLRELASAKENMFISRNKADFGKPEIVRELRELNCQYISTFRAAVNYLQL